MGYGYGCKGGGVWGMGVVSCGFSVAVEKPVALASVLVQRNPTPAIYVTFNQPVQVSC